MKLYLLTSVDTLGQATYDVAKGFVVRASNSREARILAAKDCGDEGPDVWTDAARSTCRQLKAEGASKVILRDFQSA